MRKYFRFDTPTTQLPQTKHTQTLAAAAAAAAQNQSSFTLKKCADTWHVAQKHTGINQRGSGWTVLKVLRKVLTLLCWHSVVTKHTSEVKLIKKLGWCNGRFLSIEFNEIIKLKHQWQINTRGTSVNTFLWKVLRNTFINKWNITAYISLKQTSERLSWLELSPHSTEDLDLKLVTEALTCETSMFSLCLCGYSGFLWQWPQVWISRVHPTSRPITAGTGRCAPVTWINGCVLYIFNCFHVV